MRTDSPQRAAFTLAEILVALAIIAILGAAVIPTIRGRLTVASADALAGELQGLQQAILAYRTNTKSYPQNLSFLTSVASVTAYDICGGTSGNVQAWRGPYVTRVIATDYVVGDNDTVRVQLHRSPTNVPDATTKEYLKITVSGVDMQEADILERRYDGTWNPNSGTITYQQNGSGTQGALTYQIPISGC